MRGFSLLPILGKLVVGFGILGALLVCARQAARHAPIHFSTAEQAKEFFLRNGLSIHNGTQKAISFGNYYVANHPIGFDDFHAVALRRDCGTMPAWRGILWVCEIKNGKNELTPDTVAGQRRVWGNLLVAGDEELMDRIEKLYRNHLH